LTAAAFHILNVFFPPTPLLVTELAQVSTRHETQ
jgi:hypothetical protein